MRILVINPITNGEWSERDRTYLQAIADNGTVVEVVGLAKGPRSIETFSDVVYAGPEILRLIREKSGDLDAIIINCFADPALDAARELTDKVVLGPAETSMSVALHLGARFSVISVLTNTAPWVRLQAIKLGVEGRLASAVGVEIPVLELEKNPERTVDEIVNAANEVIERDRAEVIILGCTGMVALAPKVREKLSVPLIEPAATTLKMAELLVKLGLHHHRGGLYLTPTFDKMVGY